MFEKFTDRARRAVVLAQEESRLLNHNHIGTEHILLGVIHEEEGVAARALVSLGVSLERARQQVESVIGAGQSPSVGHIPFTSRAKKVLELSLREALQLGHNYIGTEHLLLGLVREKEGVAAQVLMKAGVDLATVRRRVVEILEEEAGTEPGSAGTPREWELEEEAVGAEARGVAGRFREPVCPRCKASLKRTARTTKLEVPGPDEETTTVTFVFCSACGETLLASD